MCYTSGTTGRPKGVMLSHANLMSETAEDLRRAAEDVREGDDFIAYLPMAWIGERLYSYDLSGGRRVGLLPCNCPESPETLQRDLRELGPTGFLASAPRSGRPSSPHLKVKSEDLSGGLKKLGLRDLHERCARRGQG